jgi:hypothetical protein
MPHHKRSNRVPSDRMEAKMADFPRRVRCVRLQTPKYRGPIPWHPSIKIITKSGQAFGEYRIVNADMAIGTVYHFSVDS